MGNSFAKDAKTAPNHQNYDENRARLLGLQNELKPNEIDVLIDCYKRMDPNKDGLQPDHIKNAIRAFITSELTIHPNVIFSIFDGAEDGSYGRVSLCEFVLGYAILCRGSTDRRLKYLFAIYYKGEGGMQYLSRAQLISALTLLQRVVSEISDTIDPVQQQNEQEICEVADMLMADSSDPENKRLSYKNFIEQLKEDDVVTEWLAELKSAANEHLKYIEKRELDLVELNRERNTLRRQDPLSRSRTLLASSSSPSSSSSASRRKDKRARIPMPRKQKFVRRDNKNRSLKSIRSASRIDTKVDDSYENISAAMPFIINYDDIKFGKMLGRGACATVYECQWMHVPVAVKVFNDTDGDAAGVDGLSSSLEESRKDVVGDYVEEFWMLLQIRHPNCLLYMGICFEPVVCIVTELYKGGSVANFLHGPNTKKFSPETALEMLSGVARGMFYLHASVPPILHRDLKTSNILVNQTVTHCVICDFGLSSQFVSEASGMNRSTIKKGQNQVRLVGTPYTMAPEILQHKPYTPAADIYSFGIVMYEMFTGRFPFPAMKPMQLMFQVVEGHRPTFFDEDEVPTILENLIELCWTEDPKKRPSFGDILEVLTSEQLFEDIAEQQRSNRASLERSAVPEEEEEEVRILSRKLLDAAYRGQSDVARRLLNQGANVNHSDYDKRTALHVGKLFPNIYDEVTVMLKEFSDS